MIYVMNYCDVASMDAEQDDPSFDLESMASPQLARLTMRFDDQWKLSCQQGVIYEVMEGMGEQDESLFKFETTGWNEVLDGRSNQIWNLYYGGTLVAKMIVQQIQCDE
jgi:hypothetical protein